MNKDLIAIFEYLEREKGIKRETIIHAIEESLQVAAQKSVKGVSHATVTINSKTGDIEVFCEKEIVEDVTNPTQEISHEDAKEIDPDCQIGQYIDVVVTPRDFGRIAAQKARQVITQKLREAERDVIYEEYRHRINELISGTVKRFIPGNKLIIDLGKVEGVMPLKEYPRTEHYRVGDKVFALLKEVRDTESGGAEVVLSRSDPEFVKQLFIQEVPEINDGTVVIDKVVRDAGYRTKLTVKSTDPKVDPVGACVGMRGLRVKNVVRELNNEKVDIIPYSPDPIELLQNALSPIEIRKFSLSEDEEHLTIVIDDDDYPVVIGKRGMNAHLNGQLIGYELEVQRITDYNKGMAVQRLELGELNHPDLDAKIESIKGVNTLVFEHLVTEGFDTPRAILSANHGELAAVSGISVELADRILEQVQKDYLYLLDKTSSEEGVEVE
jgi:transcription termination/antitermination protein NusA